MTDNMKDQLDKQMNEGVKIFADQDFKRAIGQIELHKLRYGNYPNSLSELKFLSVMDSSMLSQVEYQRLDTVYELNLTSSFPKINNDGMHEVDLKYPEEFWQGLGCVKSNLR